MKNLDINTIAVRGLRTGLTLGTMIALSACGGAETTEETSYKSLNTKPVIAIFDRSSKETSILQGNALSTSDRAIASVGGKINRSANTASIGGAKGTINASRSVIELASGGSIALENGGNVYSARYNATPAQGNSSVGIIGAATQSSDMPTSGSARYAGTSKLAIQDGIDFYDLNGKANVVANFGSGNVTTTISKLSGTRISGLSKPQNVSGVGVVTVSGSSIEGNSFSGGAVSLASNALSPLSKKAKTQIGGTFYGAKALETGGTLVVNDTADGSVLIMGDFLAKQ